MAPAITLLDQPFFLDFYVAAKKSGYGSGNGPLMLANGGKQFVFTDEQLPLLRYTDTYYGNNPFFGREVIDLRHEYNI